jgi:hypothetical protein
MTDDDDSGLRSEPQNLEAIPPNPDLSEDLGYDLVDLDIITVDNPREQVLVMPKDEEMIHDDMFLVANPGALVDLIDWV